MVDNLLYYASMKSPQEFAVIVVGGGHAGCEAALAAARMGVETALITSRLDALARMPCNPSIGGLAKSHLVCELDALGGEMGRNADLTALQAKTLNLSRGPAVWATRCQCDKAAYSQRMQAVLAAQPHLTLIEDDVIDLFSVAKDADLRARADCRRSPLRGQQSVSLAVQSTPQPPNPVNPVKNLLSRGRLPIVARACAGGDDNRNRPQSPLRPLRPNPHPLFHVEQSPADPSPAGGLPCPPTPAVSCVITTRHGQFLTQAIVITAGTALRGRVWIGKEGTESAGDSRPAVNQLSAALERLGFRLFRLKTGTPPRLKASSCDFSACIRQPGDSAPLCLCVIIPLLTPPILSKTSQTADDYRLSPALAREATTIGIGRNLSVLCDQINSPSFPAIKPTPLPKLTRLSAKTSKIPPSTAAPSSVPESVTAPRSRTRSSASPTPSRTMSCSSPRTLPAP